MASIPANTGWKGTGKTFGQGGQAQVSEVVAIEGSGHPAGLYAMKILRNPGSTQALQRFEREATAIAALSEPRIVTIVDRHRERAAFLFYVMPNYAELGFEPLSRVAFDSASPFRGNAAVALEFIASCCDALAMCHAKGIVHRDLKPQNILVHRTLLEPRIIDFGCCSVEDGAAITLTDEGVGSQNYMAPECEAGTDGAIGPRSDVYSLGKLLWVLVTGQQPFARERPAFTNRNIKLLLPDRPDSWHINPVLLTSVRRDPNNRFRDATEMADISKEAARKVVGRYPPLELVRRRCHVCGRGHLVHSIPDHPISMHAIYGNPMPQGTSCYVCNVCGHLSAWDDRLLDSHLAAFDGAE